jgi:hypothetical protein
MTGNFADNGDFHTNVGIFLHAANLRHGTNGPEKSDGFGRVRTRELGYQRPARYL